MKKWENGRESVRMSEKKAWCRESGSGRIGPGLIGVWLGEFRLGIGPDWAGFG